MGWLTRRMSDEAQDYNCDLDWVDRKAEEAERHFKEAKEKVFMQDYEVQVKQVPGRIEWNLDELKAGISEQMEVYKNLEITEDKIPEAKADVATLRKIRKAIDDRRKEVKKEFAKPYEAFEAQVKGILKVIDEPIEMIADKLDGFEQKRKEEKEKHVREVYQEAIGEYGQYLPYDSVFNSKWLNATCKDKDIASDISEQIIRVKSDLEAIRALGSDIEEDLIRVYISSGNNLAAAIKRNSDNETAKRLIAQAKAEERERIAEEQRQKEEAKAEQISADETVQAAVVSNVTPCFTFRVFGVKNCKAVKNFLTFSEIEYQEV